MSNTTLIIGESGSGKSTSLRNLDHTETVIINIIDKPLPFRGYKAKYKPITKDNPEGNYFATDDFALIVRLIRNINESRADIKILVIDDFQYLLANEFMRRACEKGFEKFNELAQHAWLILKELTTTRPDLHCFVLSHSDTDQFGKVKTKTIGKMLEDKITIEGMFTTIFHALVIDGQFKFLTQNDGTHIAKSPLDMFEDRYIDNDLSIVIEKMNQYAEE